LAGAGHDAPPGREEASVGVELLDAGPPPALAVPVVRVAATVGDVDVPAAIGRHADGAQELPIARARAPPGGEKGAARVELLDAVVAGIRDVDAPAPVGCHAGGGDELSVARAVASAGGDGAAARGA